MLKHMRKFHLDDQCAILQKRLIRKIFKFNEMKRRLWYWVGEFGSINGIYKTCCLCGCLCHSSLCFNLAKWGSEGKRWKPHESHTDHAAFSSSLHIHAKKAEQVWEHCRKELIERNNIKDFDLHPLDECSDMRSILLSEKDMHKATRFLPPHMK